MSWCPVGLNLRPAYYENESYILSCHGEFTQLTIETATRPVIGMVSWCTHGINRIPPGYGRVKHTYTCRNKNVAYDRE